VQSYCTCDANPFIAFMFVHVNTHELNKSFITRKACLRVHSAEKKYLLLVFLSCFRRQSANNS
jgi:hypothetical protein